MKVVKHRKFRLREKARVRKEKSRQKLRAAAKRGDASALKKQKAEVDAARIRSASYARKRRGEKMLKKTVNKQTAHREGERKTPAKVTRKRRRKKQRKSVSAI